MGKLRLGEVKPIMFPPLPDLEHPLPVRPGEALPFTTCPLVTALPVPNITTNPPANTMPKKKARYDSPVHSSTF